MLPATSRTARALRIDCRSPRTCTASHDTSHRAPPTPLKNGDREASGLLIESTAEALGERDTEGAIMSRSIQGSRCLVLLGVALWASPAPAQSVDTGILGTVSDGSGAVIPGLDNHRDECGHERGAPHRHPGRTAPSKCATSLPGEYVVQAVAHLDFATERTTVTLRVGQLARLTFPTLQVGSLGGGR